MLVIVEMRVVRCARRLVLVLVLVLFLLLLLLLLGLAFPAVLSVSLLLIASRGVAVATLRRGARSGVQLGALLARLVLTLLALLALLPFLALPTLLPFFPRAEARDGWASFGRVWVGRVEAGRQ